MRLQDEVALITGAASGIGAATASAFVKEGARVVLTDINDEQGEALAGELGEGTIFHHLDVSCRAEWQKVMAWVVDQFGGLDVLVNNAGILDLPGGASQDPEHMSLEDFQLMHTVNLESVFLGCQQAIRTMKNSKHASIVNMSSRSGLVGVPTMAAYASTKAAIGNYTKSVALYCASQGYSIRCNSVHPGAILTPIWDSILGEEGVEARDKNIKALAKNIPLGTMGSAEDVASACVYLASDEAKYITGTQLVIDGGILAGSSAAPDKEK